MTDRRIGGQGGSVVNFEKVKQDRRQAENSRTLTRLAEGQAAALRL